jgi:hypothetical protein
MGSTHGKNIIISKIFVVMEQLFFLAKFKKYVVEKSIFLHKYIFFAKRIFWQKELFFFVKLDVFAKVEFFFAKVDIKSKSQYFCKSFKTRKLAGMTGISCGPICRQWRKILKRSEEEE